MNSPYQLVATNVPFTMPVMPLYQSPSSRVIAELERYFQLEAGAIVGPKRYREIARARQIGYWILYRLKHQSSMQIGRAFKRDHSSVLQGMRLIDYLKDREPWIADAIEEIPENIGW
jgi:chromosomal replication initiation ATPase DnaA